MLKTITKKNNVDMIFDLLKNFETLFKIFQKKRKFS